MFSNLESVLHFSCSSPPNGKSVLITERGTDGSFLLHHLVSTYLKAGNGVCLVGLAQTFTHYRCIATKFSLNLEAEKKAGRLVFVDAMAATASEIVSGNSGGSSSVCFPLGADELQQRQSLKGFYEAIRAAMGELSDWKSKPTLLVVDDLSLLVCLGHSSFSVAVLAQYLQNLVCYSGDGLGAFAMLIHADPAAKDDEMESLQRQLAHRCHQLVYIDPLKTGYCRDVDGTISVEFKNLSTEKKERERTEMHFKLTDKGISVFPFGMSTAVL